MSQHTELIARLRNTPNWQRESYGDWKNGTLFYDRAPFEAADALEAIDALQALERGLSDAEPVNRCITELLAFAKDHPGTYIFPSWDGSRVMKYLATSPQAAQTALKSESSAQAAQAPARLPGEGKTIEALALTEAQEREAFEEFMLTKYPAHLCHWVGDQYSEMFARLVFVGWKAGRAGSKP